MAYLNAAQLSEMGFASLGRDVKISDKASVYNADQIEIGDFSRIDDFCVLSGRVTIGRNVHIAPQSLVSGGRAGAALEDFTGLAYGAKVIAQSDDYSGATLTNPTVPLAFKREIEAPVTIGRHSILGAGAIVLPGVSLGEGCSVGAGSVVISSVPAWTIVAGVPAKFIKSRDKGLLTHEQSYLAQDDT